MSVDKCRRVTWRVQTNIDECVRINNAYFDSRKSDTWPHFIVVAIMQQ